ncbi:MAG: Na+/H+ antiporter NhaC [bacterium]|nr:Na+/H+ antiporter NhaC [bacterium]
MKKTEFKHALLPILFLLVLIIYGLIIRPQLQGLPPFPLEVLFIFAGAFAITQMLWMGFSWDEILKAIINKISSGMPAFLILLSIGLIIGSWIVCGTIPMMVYYGLKIINPNYLYLLAFCVPAVFSLMTGTSWGSAGAVGIVIMGISGAMNGHMGITAGAVIAGAYFGDKMSPLSDTTNMAAIATDVYLFDHIRSMMNTTFPSTIIALCLYLAMGFIYPPGFNSADLSSIMPFLNSLDSMFSFNPLLLLPPLIVLYGSFKKKPVIPVIFVSMLSASILAMIFQNYTLADILQSLYRGFTTNMAVWVSEVPERVDLLLNRGGLYALNDAVIIAFTVFVFIGTIDLIDAMPTVVNRIFRYAKRRASTIIASLAAAAVTNSLTSNQYATSFIVGDAFKTKYDALKIPRKVLSRSIEDTGTMIESLIPWHPTCVFMVATLGIPLSEYWNWQFLTVINFVIAPLLAVTGIGCFYNEVREKNNKSDTE